MRSTSFGCTLPAGLSLNGFVINGTPTQAGTTSVSITATNANGTSDPFTLVITINPSGAPSITSVLQATAAIGSPFAYTITASGTNPITFNATNLPDGLTFNGSTISGTPTTIGVTQIALTATNAGGTDAKILSLTVTNPGVPVIT